MNPYAALSQRSQQAVMRRVAGRALPAFNLANAKLKLVTHSFNTTFRVTHPEGEFAMRINVNSMTAPEEIAAEVAWVEALGQSGTVLVPTPRRTVAGEAKAMIDCPELGRQVPVVVYSWLEGRGLGTFTHPATARQMGRALAAIQDHGRTFNLPAGTTRKRMESVLLTAEYRLPEETVFRDTFDAAEAVVAKLKARPAQLTHFDLHFWNVRHTPRGLAVFDFDDCFYAWPTADLAQSLFYMRRRHNAEALEAAFREGAAVDPACDGLTEDELEILVAGRLLLLANDMQGNMTAEIAEMAPTYLKASRVWLRDFWRTGRFRTQGSFYDAAKLDD
jgi:Ser/Thr protein kinase RdoA (MazF antagonist)